MSFTNGFFPHRCLAPKFETREDAMEALIPPGSVGAELGVLRGNHALRYVPRIRPSKLYLVDPWRKQDARFSNVKQKLADYPCVSLVRSTAVEAAPTIERLDWVEHDTAEGWPGAWESLVAYNKKVKPGGIVMFDYASPEYTKGERFGILKKLLRHSADYVIVGVATDTDSLFFRKLPVDTSLKTREQMYETRFPKESVGLEVGVYKGKNARELATIVRPKKLTLCDVWDSCDEPYRSREFMVSAFNEVLGRMAAERESGVVEIVRESDSIYIPSITDESLDWVYIDADHRYESVLNDLRLVYPKVKHGGIIAGHDFVYSVKDGDVIYAVLDFLKETPGLMLEAISGQPGARSYMTRKA